MRNKVFNQRCWRVNDANQADSCSVFQRLCIKADKVIKGSMPPIINFPSSQAEKKKILSRREHNLEEEQEQ